MISYFQILGDFQTWVSICIWQDVWGRLLNCVHHFDSRGTETRGLEKPEFQLRCKTWVGEFPRKLFLGYQKSMKISIFKRLFFFCRQFCSQRHMNNAALSSAPEHPCKLGIGGTPVTQHCHMGGRDRRLSELIGQLSSQSVSSKFNERLFLKK